MKFKPGDRVKVIGGIWEGHEFTVDKEDVDSIYGESYTIKNDEKPFGFSMVATNLESLEETVNLDNDPNMQLFIETLDPTIKYGEGFMEGVINHMIDAGIDPKVNDPMNYIYLQKMAGKIPRDKTGTTKLIVAVGGDEGNIPHFHVFRNEIDWKMWKNGACLFFTQNRYYDHSDNAETLTRKEMKELITILKKPLKNHPDMTNWIYLVDLWNYNNDMYEIPDNTPMPNYDFRTIKRYEEGKKK